MIRSIAIGATLALLITSSALAKPETVQVGNLVLSHDGGISPTKLPKREQAPLEAHLSASIATVDGSHLPAAREVIVDVDRDIHVNARGLPVCQSKQLQSRDSDAARRVCGKAIVGKGSALAEIAFPEQPPIVASSPLTMFNGGVRGRKTTIFIHAFLTVPVPAAVVATVELTRTGGGRFGTHVVAKIPAIAGGAGSLSGAELRIDRKFTYGGTKSSYLTASCPTGRHLLKGRVLFDDATLVNLGRVLLCTPIAAAPTRRAW